MVELKNEKHGEYTYVYGYNINEETPDVFEYIVKIYTDNNKWGLKDLLSDVMLYRCSLHSLSTMLLMAKESLINVIESNFENYLNLKRIIKTLPNYEGIYISLPSRVQMLDRGCPDGFRSYRSSFYPVTVTIEPHEYSDFSRVFQDFDTYHENVVEEALKVFEEVGSMVGLTTKEVEKKLIKNIETREELGLK